MLEQRFGTLLDHDYLGPRNGPSGCNLELAFAAASVLLPPEMPMLQTWLMCIPSGSTGRWVPQLAFSVNLISVPSDLRFRLPPSFAIQQEVEPALRDNSPFSNMDAQSSDVARKLEHAGSPQPRQVSVVVAAGPRATPGFTHTHI